MSVSATPARQRSPWYVLAIVALPVFIGALDLTIISAVLPEVLISLRLPVKEYLGQASWAVNGYLLAYAISMTFTGRLSDLVGRRAIYISCLLIFIFGSYMVTAYDSSLLNGWIARFYNTVLGHRPPRLEVRYLYLVIFGRIIQALGAGAMVPVTFALVGDLFPATHRGKPLGVVGAIDTMGWVLGHLYGGIMVRLFGEHGGWFVDAFARLGIGISKPSWETLFILNIPISLVALAAAWWALRDVRHARSAGRFDWLGTVLISLALVGLNLGLGSGSTESVGGANSFEDLRHAASSSGLFLVAAGLALLLFLLVESRSTHPLIRLGMFRSRNVSAASLTNMMVGFCLAIGLVSAPLLVNFRVDMPTSEEIQRAALVAGVLLSGLTIPMALAAIPGGWLAERFGYRRPTLMGLLLASLGFLFAGLVWEENTSYWIMGAQMAMIGVGLGLTISPVGAAVIDEAREDERGVASALILILRLVGMTIALSSLTIYSLDRFDKIAAHKAAGLGQNVGDIVETGASVSLDAAVQVISELQYIGAVVSAIALLCALFLHGGRSPATETGEQPLQPRRDLGDIAPAVPDD